MKVRYYFLLLVALMVMVLLLVTYMAIENGSSVFYVVEALVVITLLYLPLFYRKIVKPLNTISSGLDLLKEQDFSSRLSRVGQVEADRVVDIFNRMMNQLKEERLRVREQNHFLDLLINASPMGVILQDTDGFITQINPAALQMLDVEAQPGTTVRLRDIDSPLAAELLKIPLESSHTIRLSDANIYKCSYRSFIDKGFQHPFYLIESLTEEVMRAEKRAYEKVIRMIAHEVNNSVAGITSTLDTVDNALKEYKEMRDIGEVMQVCIERCYQMSKFIVRFAEVVKIPEPVKIPVNLNELAIFCTRFMESSCRERNITISTELDPSVPVLMMDSSLMEQVLVNIIKNAAESIGEDGEIRVRTFMPAGIEIIDNGPGISTDAEEKLFTPFFSTKPNGQGIGLIFIREILNRHHCSFSLRTYQDGLTRFRIRFQ